MSDQMERIPVPEKLDEVIRKSIGQLKREKRRKRMTAAAGIASAAVICMAGYAAGRYGAYIDMTEKAGAGQEENRMETERLLVQNEEAKDAAYVGNVCLQESHGITVTTSNVYHNQYTLYMTVVIRSEEDFPEAPGQAGAGWKGTVRLAAEGKAKIGEEEIVPETFNYEWKISGIELAGEDEQAAYCGNWEFAVEVHQGGGYTECGYGGVNENGEGIGQIIHTKEDITAEKLLPGNRESLFWAPVLSVIPEGVPVLRLSLGSVSARASIWRPAFWAAEVSSEKIPEFFSPVKSGDSPP